MRFHNKLLFESNTGTVKMVTSLCTNTELNDPNKKVPNEQQEITNSSSCSEIEAKNVIADNQNKHKICQYCRGNPVIVKTEEELFADCIRKNFDLVVKNITDVCIGEKKKMIDNYKKVFQYSIIVHNCFDLFQFDVF